MTAHEELTKKSKTSIFLGNSPAPVADGGTEAMDEKESRARPFDEVIDVELLPLPGGAAVAYLLELEFSATLGRHC